MSDQTANSPSLSVRVIEVDAVDEGAPRSSSAPQIIPTERTERVMSMVAAANRELFGSCTNIGECEAVCPKLIKLEVIARMNRDFIRASWSRRS